MIQKIPAVQLDIWYKFYANPDIIGTSSDKELHCVPCLEDTSI